MIVLAFTSSANSAQDRPGPRNDLIIKRINVNYRSKGGSGFEGFESKGLSSMGQGSSVGKWAQIDVQYRSDKDWTNEVTLQFYVLLNRTLLKGRVTQINISKGQRHFAGVYIHPTTIERYGEVQKVAVQLLYKGEVMDSDQWPQKTKKEWWNQSPAQEGFLKKHFQTPFALDQPGHYEDTRWSE